MENKEKNRNQQHRKEIERMKNPIEPLLGEYTVIQDHYAAIPEADARMVNLRFTEAPSLVKTSDGALLCARPMVFWDAPLKSLQPLHFFRSEDGGKSWSKLSSSVGFYCGTLLPHGKFLYFIGAGPRPRQADTRLRIIRSDNEGRTWSEPVDLFDKPFHMAASGYVVRNGQFYWCCDTGRDTTYVIAGDLSRDLTDPAAWRISEGVRNPGVPSSLTVGEGKSDWLEGNVVEVKGCLRVYWRYKIDQQSTAGIAAICEFKDDGERLDYRFVQFYPLPGAQNHFHIIRDDVSGLYWMTSNLPTRTQDQEFRCELESNPRYQGGDPGNERRILALHCSFDALNWLPAGYVVIWPLVRQSSNYSGLLIDGDDLLVACRTSRDGLDQHDNDLTTFHRMKNFRDLAKALLPGEDRDS